MRHILFYILLSVAGLGAGLWAAGTGVAQDSTGAEPDRACDAPLTYRIREVDPRFGLSTEALRKVTREAVALWEAGAPDRLFAYAPDGELTIDLAYDERQGTWEAHQRAETALERARTRHAEQVEAHDARRHRLTTAQAAYEQEAASLARRLARHNRAVRAWNGGEVEHTDERAQALQEEREALAQLRRRVDAQADSVEALRQRFNRHVEAVNQATTELNRQVRRFNEQYARGGGYNKGVYTHTRNGRTVERAITVFQFHDRDDLRQVLAHELGHALGISHVSSAAALMHHQVTERNEGLARLTAADRRALRQACGG